MSEHSTEEGEGGEMSEPEGSFDAAIEVLDSWDVWNVTRVSFDAAIRVLKAAGRYAENPCSDTAADLIEEVGKHGKV